MVNLPESSWCCGSAGIYNITQPEMAGELLRRKLDHIKSTGAQVVATANPGCLLQIINGAREEGLTLRVVHPITLLAEAYRRVVKSSVIYLFQSGRGLPQSETLARVSQRMKFLVSRIQPALSHQVKLEFLRAKSILEP